MLRKTSPKTIVGKIRIEKHLRFTGETHQDYSKKKLTRFEKAPTKD